MVINSTRNWHLYSLWYPHLYSAMWIPMKNVQSLLLQSLAQALGRWLYNRPVQIFLLHDAWVQHWMPHHKFLSLPIFQKEIYFLHGWWRVGICRFGCRHRTIRVFIYTFDYSCWTTKIQVLKNLWIFSLHNIVFSLLCKCRYDHRTDACHRYPAAFL